ncbi:Structural maintenance of chromosomes protein 5 [Dispira simplex]|nr:Structural maintenance of chromosomes protein 5 [Dispira simplex]
MHFSEIKAGSIVRVSLRHFVTYDACKFHPGPHLNMIIGPNGTGKSTIVCAIALGLGGNPSILGRAKDISAFVKHGYEKASIEIELQGQPNQRNLIVSRHIQRKSNSSSWQLNHRTATFKEVQEAVRVYRIQVDNLCQFLPQDRVCEFARMTPSELLRETQKAAGTTQLSEWHQQLGGMYKEQKQLESQVNRQQTDMDLLIKRNEVLEREVRTYQERQATLHRIAVLEARIPMARYQAAREKREKLREERKLAHQNYKQLERQHRPHMQRKEAIQAEIHQAQEQKVEAEQECSATNRQFTNNMNEIEKLTSQYDDQRSTLKSFKDREVARQQELAKLRQEVEQLQQEIRVGPPSDRSDEINRNLADISERNRELHAKVRELQGKQQDVVRESRQVNDKIASKHQELVNLDDVRNQRLLALQKFNVDSYQAVQWLRQNRSQFDQPVFEPICLEIDLKDPQHSHAVETLIQASTLKTFVCQTEGDYHRFTAEVNDRMGLKVNVVVFPRKQLSQYKPPLPVDQVQELGFDQYALDMVDGPAAVLVALCELDKLHATPVARGNVDNERVVDLRVLRQYVANNTLYNVQFSRYGNRLPFVQTMGVRPGVFLGQSANMDHRNRLEDEIDGLRRQLTQNESRIRELKQAENDLRAEDHQLRSEKEHWAEQKLDNKKRMHEFERKGLQLDTLKSRLQELRLAPERERIKQEEIKAKLHSLAVRRGRCVLQAKDFLERAVENQLKATQAFLGHLQAMNRMSQVEEELEAYDQELRQAAETFQTVEAQFKHSKDEMETERRNLDNHMRRHENDQILEEARDYEPDATLEKLELALVSERASLNLRDDVNSASVEQYEERQAQIDRLREQLEVHQARLTTLITNLRTIQEQWEPALMDIVQKISEKFSAAFDRIGCAGEVKLSKHEDFDKWGIDILVKFRERESLQLLTGQRQSGGERSVSTILYLMALQGLAVAPFRVVDEINQGMDPRNERMVHRQLVYAACETQSSQYFLITPKLLPNLEYHPKMKVLCIYNGEWQPDNFPLKAYIRNKEGR